MPLALLGAMTTLPASVSSGATAGVPWTCPYCSLLCDGYTVATAPQPTLLGSACPTAMRGLARSREGAADAAPLVIGRRVDYAAALDAAAHILRQSRQPLFAGLATDVAGARALYRLADACGAILDHARGEALMQATRALQDRGSFFTTLAEIRNRADLIVCIGTNPADNYPEFFRRCSPATGAERARRVDFLGASAASSQSGLEVAAVDDVPLHGDLFDSLAYLAARLAGRRTAVTLPALDALAQRMQAASYTVLVWEAARLPEHGALLVETIQRLATILNRTTRAATFNLGGSDGGASLNQVLAWLSGLPLRTGVHARGLVHEPQRYATARLLAQSAVDALLWVASFGPEPAPPATDLPRVVLGHPGLAARLASGPDSVFIPVSTPGIGSPGHLFRTDGVVVVPLHALYADGLPSVAQVVADLTARLPMRGQMQGEAQ
jgi:formylmethanofuran dehydrogenase subunit B